MSDYISPVNTSVPLMTLLGALFAKDSTSGVHQMRVLVITPLSISDPISCSSQDEVDHLFQRSLELAPDNKPAVRLVITDYAGGTGLEDVEGSGNQKAVMRLARLSFVETDQGVAIALANIVAPVEPEPEPEPDPDPGEGGN